MATERVKSARRLAALLTQDTGVQVAVCYQRTDDNYEVQWDGGPIEDYMQSLAHGHADQVPHLAIGTLVWSRRTARSSS